MRAGRGAAVGVVTKGVDVEATLCVGVVAGDVVGDGGRGTLRGLLEDDGAGDLGVSSEDSDCNAGLARCVVDSTNSWSIKGHASFSMDESQGRRVYQGCGAARAPSRPFEHKNPLKRAQEEARHDAPPRLATSCLYIFGARRWTGLRTWVVMSYRL